MSEKLGDNSGEQLEKESFDLEKFDYIATEIEKLYRLSLRHLFKKEYKLPEDQRKNIGDLLRENEGIFKQAVLERDMMGRVLDVLSQLTAVRDEENSDPYENELSW